jgi:hypothetical protein
MSFHQNSTTAHYLKFRDCGTCFPLSRPIIVGKNNTFLGSGNTVELKIDDSGRVGTFTGLNAKTRYSNLAVGAMIVYGDYTDKLEDLPKEYDNTTSGLTATSIQGAIDEIIVDFTETKDRSVVLDDTEVGVNNIGAVIPANTTVVKVTVNVTEAFNGSATLKIGDAGDDDRLMAIAEIDLTSTGVYVTECYYLYGSETQLIATLAGSPTAGECSITSVLSFS